MKCGLSWRSACKWGEGPSRAPEGATMTRGTVGSCSCDGGRGFKEAWAPPLRSRPWKVPPGPLVPRSSEPLGAVFQLDKTPGDGPRAKEGATGLAGLGLGIGFFSEAGFGSQHLCRIFRIPATELNISPNILSLWGPFHHYCIAIISRRKMEVQLAQDHKDGK